MLRQGNRTFARLDHLHLMLATALSSPALVLEGLDPLALITRHVRYPLKRPLRQALA